MTLYDLVSQHAVNLFLEPLRSMRICDDSVKIRTDTTLDQLCTEGNCASMYSVHDRVIVDNMSEFEHSSSRAGCTFSMQDSRVKRGSTTGHKTQQARLPADYGLYNSTFPSLVHCILTIPECRSDHHGSCTSTMVLTKCLLSLSSSRFIGLLKVLCQFTTWRQSVHKIFLLLVGLFLLVLCSLLVLC